VKRLTSEERNKALQIAEDLKIWSSARGVEDDPYVTQLQNDLTQGENLEFWASSNPIDLLPTPIKTEVVKLQVIARYISIVRNVLIFLPVALTWYAIGQATIAFQIYVGSTGITTANFLDFWQNGYGILADKWRIGEIAVLDFQIVMGVIVISLVAGIFQVMATSKDATLDLQYDEERSQLALQISRFLYPFRSVSSRDDIDGLLRDIKSAGQSLLETSKNLNKASSSLLKLNLESKKSITDVKKSLEKNNQIVKVISSESKKSSASNKNLVNSIKQLQKSLLRRK
jgi:methyl-accepting chemotaxis protein